MLFVLCFVDAIFDYSHQVGTGSYLEVSRCLFKGCSSNQGGGVYYKNADGKFFSHHNQWVSCISQNEGGGFYSESKIGICLNDFFEGCIHITVKGHVDGRAGHLRVSDYSHNNGTLVYRSSPTQIVGGHICFAQYYGDAITHRVNCTQNYGQRYGGYFVDETRKAAIKYCIFDQQVSPADSEGILIHYGLINFECCLFFNNTNAAIISDNAVFNMTDCVFMKNAVCIQHHYSSVLQAVVNCVSDVMLSGATITDSFTIHNCAVVTQEFTADRKQFMFMTLCRVLLLLQ